MEEIKTIIPIVISIIALLGVLISGAYPYFKARKETGKEIIESSVMLMRGNQERIEFLIKDNAVLRNEVKDLRAYIEIIGKQNAYIPDLEAVRAEQSAQIEQLTGRIEYMESSVFEMCDMLRKALANSDKIDIGKVFDVIEDIEEKFRV